MAKTERKTIDSEKAWAEYARFDEDSVYKKMRHPFSERELSAINESNEARVARWLADRYRGFNCEYGNSVCADYLEFPIGFLNGLIPIIIRPNSVLSQAYRHGDEYFRPKLHNALKAGVRKSARTFLSHGTADANDKNGAYLYYALELIGAIPIRELAGCIIPLADKRFDMEFELGGEYVEANIYISAVRALCETGAGDADFWNCFLDDERTANYACNAKDFTLDERMQRSLKYYKFIEPDFVRYTVEDFIRSGKRETMPHRKSYATGLIEKFVTDDAVKQEIISGISAL